MTWPTVRALAAELADERLVGAACAGRAPLFDAELPGEDDNERRYRLAAAGRICQACPALVACNTVARELGRDAAGVWAGRRRNLPQPRGRPRSAAGEGPATGIRSTLKALHCNQIHRTTGGHDE